jgi:hypothetical protein
LPRKSHRPSLPGFPRNRPAKSSMMPTSHRPLLSNAYWRSDTRSAAARGAGICCVPSPSMWWARLRRRHAVANRLQSSSVPPQALTKASMQSNAGRSSVRSIVQIVEAAGVPPARLESSRNEGRPAQIRYSRSEAVKPAGVSAWSGSGRKSNPVASRTRRDAFAGVTRSPGLSWQRARAG